MVNLTIDGKKITVEEGTTILKAAEKLGIEIPTFCFHDKLESVGACRMCLVEVERMPKLQVACATVVSEGMVVKTNTPEVIRARKGILEFLLINHPLDCPACDKGGECDLQNFVFKYGSDKSRFVEEKRRFIVDPKSKLDDLSIGPEIIRNMNRCILCRRCVRFIKEIAGENDLGTFRRGAKSEINVLSDIPADNPYSGNVVEICPVGALTSKSFRYKIRVWQTEKTPSICPHCGDGCNITLWSKDDRIYRITSRRNDQIDEGFLCDKGRFGPVVSEASPFEFVNHPERLSTPLIKKNGEFVPCDWDEALGFVADKFKATREKFGNDSFAGIGSSKLTNEDNYIFQKFFRTVIGTNNIDHRVDSKNPLSSPNVSNPNQIYTMINSITEIESAKLILVFGCDLEKEHPIINLRVMKSVRKGNALVLLNSAKTRLNRFAQDELIYNKGTEVTLLNGLAREILEEKLFDLNRIEVSKEELDRLRQSVSPYDTERVSQTTGIDSDKIKSLVNSFARAESIIILCGREVISHPQNKELLDSLYSLILLTGHWGKEHSGVNVLWEHCNSQGALDCGLLPDRLPGFVHILDESGRKRIEGIWKTELPDKPGLDFNHILSEIHEGKIRSLYIMGEDPLLKCPDRNYVESALKKIDFLVVQDTFMTETARLADVVLPGASFAEKDGTFTNVERRVQRLKRATDPLGNSKADWRIVCLLAQAMGYEFDYLSAKEIFDEIVSVSPIYKNMTYEEIGETGIQWKLKTGDL
jgi:formate dehydrogenase alpha subunit